MIPTTAPNNSIEDLKKQVQQANLPPDLAEYLLKRLERVQFWTKSSGFQAEFDKELGYINFVSCLPYSRSSQDILDLERAASILDRNHYGLKSVKSRILEYLAVLILNTKANQKFHAPILAFVGLVGSGKTSLAASVAESLGRKFIRIPLGGLGSVEQLRGQSRMSSADAEPGSVIKAIAKASANNPVILLDEIDRVALENKADLMGVLVELLDPEQNFAFTDHYIDYPFDLSNVLFIVTANNTTNVATAVLDRLEIVEMPAYSDEEKIIIGKQYILPKVIKEAGLSSNVVTVDEAVWPQVVRPLGFDAGVRSLQRTIQQLIRRIAKEVVEGNPGPFKLDSQNMTKYIQSG